MYALFFWIAIALLGLFVYALPSFTVRHMYEAYENMNTAPTAPTAPTAAIPVDPVQSLLKTQDNAVPTGVVPIQRSPNAPTGPAGTTDFQALVQSVQSLLKPGTMTPDIGNNDSSTNTLPPTVVAVGAKPQPEGASTKQSMPQTAMDAMIPVQSSALQQGVSFQNTKPSPVIIVNQIPSAQQSGKDGLLQNNQITRNGCPNMKDYIRRDMVPKQKQQQCPPPSQCPDMSKYIRKDSIPCWACKL